jgi:hypothetical protein
MEPVQNVGQVFFPLDKELALVPGSLTPKQQEHLTHLGSWMPFAQAAKMLDTLLGVQVSEPSVRRGTEHAGVRYEARQTAQSQQPMEPCVQAPLEVRQVMSTDGCYVPLVGGEWAEVRTVVIGEVDAVGATASSEVHVSKLSCFARMTDAATFAHLAEVEMRRRQVSRAQVLLTRFCRRMKLRLVVDQFKLNWAEIAQGRVLAHAIVIHLNVLKEGCTGLLMGCQPHP